MAENSSLFENGRELGGGKILYTVSVGTLIVGAGAAGLKTAVTLDRFGKKDLLLVSEGLRSGTSRNTGSDKQTYYKLSLAGDAADSVRAMAEDLFAGECVDGEHALAEAALSVRSFYHLADAGVPFPENEYGESIGYRTDHDSRGRASSAGPYTSKLMTEALFQEAVDRGIPMEDRLQLIRIFTKDEALSGALFLLRSPAKEAPDRARFVLFRCENLVLATGGPAAMYRDSVYPLSQTGASGTAFLAGVRGRNLTEWQFGMASVKPRWNVSGSYMQVLPRFISTDENGEDPREFLNDYYDDPEQLLLHVFRKGYEWPFDAAKLEGGSSLIDLFVFEETVVRGRHVFLDYREDPSALSGSQIPEEAFTYLNAADALAETPVERLLQLNKPAYDFYLEHGVDLKNEMLEIRISAQHNNGGLLVDAHWQTNIRGIYAVGEVSCTHGVRRPGGSALNAGQCGATRAAEAIAFSGLSGRNAAGAGTSAVTAADLDADRTLVSRAEEFLQLLRFSPEDRIAELFTAAAARMSAAGGMIRNAVKISEALEETDALLQYYFEAVHPSGVRRLGAYYRLYDVLTAQKVYLSAMQDYILHGSGSRGSALYTAPGGVQPHPALSETYRYEADAGRSGHLTQETWLQGSECVTRWRPVHPIPDAGLFFEAEWKKFRERRGL